MVYKGCNPINWIATLCWKPYPGLCKSLDIVLGVWLLQRWYIPLSQRWHAGECLSTRLLLNTYIFTISRRDVL
jgi:hypothetical protein